MRLGHEAVVELLASTELALGALGESELVVRRTGGKSQTGQDRAPASGVVRPGHLEESVRVLADQLRLMDVTPSEFLEGLVFHK